MDKMVVSKTGEVIITNDGATILARMEVAHPAAKMLVDLAKSQDTEAGDGTTSVTVLCGAILEAAQRLLEKGIHPTIISEAFLTAEKKAEQYIEAISRPVDLGDRDELIKVASTSLNSKVVSANAAVLAPIAVDAMLRIIDPATSTNVDLRDVAIVKKLGGTIDDTELVDGLVFTQKAVKVAGGPTRVANAKIGLIQFCLSPPKTDIDQSVIVSDYAQMDRILKEERKYMLDMCKQIAKTGCNVLLVQKSILRDAVTDLSLHFLAKLKILVVTDIERDDVEFICKTVGCHPIASIESFVVEKLGRAELVAEEATPDSKIVRVTGVPNPGKTVTIFVRASNRMVLDEVRRSAPLLLLLVLPAPPGPAAEARTPCRRCCRAPGGPFDPRRAVRAALHCQEAPPHAGRWRARGGGLVPALQVRQLARRHRGLLREAILAGTRGGRSSLGSGRALRAPAHAARALGQLRGGASRPARRRRARRAAHLCAASPARPLRSRCRTRSPRTPACLRSTWLRSCATGMRPARPPRASTCARGRSAISSRRT